MIYKAYLYDTEKFLSNPIQRGDLNKPHNGKANTFKSQYNLFIIN